METFFQRENSKRDIYDALTDTVTLIIPKAWWIFYPKTHLVHIAIVKSVDKDY